jgi:hypothetical protein
MQDKVSGALSHVITMYPIRTDLAPTGQWAILDTNTLKDASTWESSLRTTAVSGHCPIHVIARDGAVLLTLDSVTALGC